MYDEYNNEDNNQRRNPFNVSRRILLIILLGAVVLSFGFGFLLSYVVRVPIADKPPVNGGDTVEMFSDLYKFLDENYYEEFDVNNALINQLFAIVDSLGDPYTRISSATISIDTPSGPDSGEDIETFEGIGITYSYEDFEMVVSKVTRNSPAEKANIYPGDRVIGLMVEGKAHNFKTNNNSSEQVVRMVAGKKGDTRVLIVKRLDSTIINIPITYDRFATPSVISEVINDDYAYIKIYEFSTHTANVFRDHLALLESSTLTNENKTLILDLRDNPGGMLTTVVDIIKQLIVDDGKTVVGIHSTKSGAMRSYTGGLAPEDKKVYDIKVLVNEYSASASEMLAIALYNSGGYEVFGTNTYGKNVFQETTLQFAQKYGIALTYTKGYWYYGDFKRIDKIENPIPVTPLLPQGVLTFDIPGYSYDLRLDDVHPALINIQKFLNVKYNLSIRTDGYFDVATESALKQFQTESGLVANGIYTLQTSHKMYSAYILMKEDLSKDNQVLALIP